MRWSQFIALILMVLALGACGPKYSPESEGPAAPVSTTDTDTTPDGSADADEESDDVEGVAEADYYVFSVTDGDTLQVKGPGGNKKIRLFAVDAPERSQPYGSRATDKLAEKVLRKNVVLIERTRDGFGRTVATVIFGDRDINLEMVEEGFAWHYTFFARNQSPEDRESYSSAQQNAKDLSYGLWEQSNPEAPWRYRRRNR